MSEQTVPEQVIESIRSSEYPELSVSEIAMATDLSAQQIRTAAINADQLVFDAGVGVVHLAGDQPTIDDEAEVTDRV